MSFRDIPSLYSFLPTCQGLIVQENLDYLQTKLQILRDNNKPKYLLGIFSLFYFLFAMWPNYVRPQNYLDYAAPGDPKIPLGSENPKEYLSLALYLTFPVSKSPSIAVLIGALTNIFNPLGTSVLMKNASVSVK